MSAVLLVAALAAAAPPEAPLDAAAWLAAVQETRGALRDRQPGGVDQLRALASAQVAVGDVLVDVRDPLLPVLAEAMAIGVPEARDQALRHLAAVERQAAGLVSAAPLPDVLEAPASGAAGQPAARAVPRRLDTLRDSLRGWAGSLRGTGEAGLLLLVGGVVACGLLAASFTGLRRLSPPVPPAPAPPQPALPVPEASPATPTEQIRASFLELLALVERRGWLRPVARSTNGAVAQALDGVAWERFRVAREIYERTWYGGLEPAEGDLLRVREALDAIREPR